MSHESIMNQQINCTQNLPFEVIAVPQYDDSRSVKSAANSLTDPVNVKIRIRNKEEIAKKHGIISAPKLATNSGRKVRLIGSDQTIMSFDFFVEPDTTKKQQKKSHKNIFHIFRPGGCLKSQDNNDDEYHYSPSSFTDINNIKDPSYTTEDQLNIISEKIILKKNFPSATPTHTSTKTTGNFMGKCKPGGCLDPPFNEDKYSYKPATAISNTSSQNRIDGNKNTLTRKATVDSLNIINNIKINTHDTGENIIRTQLDNKTYQENYSNSLITYSSSSTDNFQIYKQSNDMNLKKLISCEDKARISVNEFSEIYFMPPKKDKTKIIEKISPVNVSGDNKSAFEDEKSKCNVTNHIQLKSPTLTTDNLISLDSDSLKSQLNIEPCQKKYFVNETNVELKISADGRHTLENVKFLPVAHSSIENINKNIISSQSSTIYLANIDKSHKSLLDYEKTYSQVDLSYDKNKTDNMIEIKKNDNPIKENIETNLLSELKLPFMKNEHTQNIILNDTTGNISDPPTEINYSEHYLKASQESLKIKHEETDNLDEIVVPSLNYEEMQNLGKNENSNNVSAGSKPSEVSKKESQLITPKFEEIFKTNENKNTLSKSEEKKDTKNMDVSNNEHDIILPAIESKSSLWKTQQMIMKDPVQIIGRNEETKLFITNTDRADLDSNISSIYNYTTEKATALDNAILNDQKGRNFEKDLEPDNIFSDNYHTVPFETQNSIDILTSEDDKYAAMDLNFHKKYITDMMSYDNLKKSVIRTLSSKTSNDKFSLTSIIQDKTDETNHKSFYKDKSLRTAEKNKYLCSSKSLISTIDSGKHFHELNKSKSSITSNISDQIKNQTNELNTALEISEMIEDSDEKLKFRSNAPHDTNEPSKKLLPIGLENVDGNLIRDLRSIDRVKEETEVIPKVQLFDENRLDLSTYSSVAVDFGFRCSIDDKNKLVISTFDTSIPSNEEKSKVTVIKSIIRINSDEIRIPLNFDTDLLMQIKKAEMTGKGLISNKEITPQQDLIEKSSDKIMNKDLFLQETLNSVYENLIPLNKIIQNLKDEANALSRQQTSFKEILATMEMKPKRLIHTDPRCGC